MRSRNVKIGETWTSCGKNCQSNHRVPNEDGQKTKYDLETSREMTGSETNRKDSRDRISNCQNHTSVFFAEFRENPKEANPRHHTAKTKNQSGGHTGRIREIEMNCLLELKILSNEVRQRNQSTRNVAKISNQRVQCHKGENSHEARMTDHLDVVNHVSDK